MENEPAAEEKPAEGEATENAPAEAPAEGEPTDEVPPEDKPPEEEPYEPPPEEPYEPPPEEPYEPPPEVIEEIEESIEECASGIESMDSAGKELARICDPNLKKNYINYVAVVKEIQTQNRIIQKIKADIRKLCCKAGRTKCDNRDIRALKCCYGEESEKLTCLMQKAIELQSHDPNRRFKNINLETSPDEQMMIITSNRTSKSGRYDKYNSSEDSFSRGKVVPKDMKRLQEALEKMQKSIEKMQHKIKQLKHEEDDDPVRSRSNEKLKSACEILQNVGGRSALTKAPIEVDEGICGDQDDSELLQCIITQQSNLLEEYSQKYIKVQKKVGEQNDIIQKLENKSKLMEEEINSEVEQVKSKFMEKINDLADYPTILENEKKRVAQASKDRELMECKLRTLCKQLRQMKNKSYQQEATYNYEQQNDPQTLEIRKEELKQCKENTYRLQGEMEKIENDKEKLTGELDTAIFELETLRCESAKNISKMKGLAGCFHQTFQVIIDKTEKELAECKASSCLAVAERDETIKEMRKQMNTLAFSFDAAQKEIQCLKHKIFTLAKESHKPVNCNV